MYSMQVFAYLEGDVFIYIKIFKFLDYCMQHSKALSTQF